MTLYFSEPISNKATEFSLKTTTPQCKHKMENGATLDVVVFRRLVIGKLLPGIDKPATRHTTDQIFLLIKGECTSTLHRNRVGTWLT